MRSIGGREPGRDECGAGVEGIGGLGRGAG